MHAHIASFWTTACVALPAACRQSGMLLRGGPQDVLREAQARWHVFSGFNLSKIPGG